MARSSYGKRSFPWFLFILLVLLAAGGIYWLLGPKESQNAQQVQPALPVHVIRALKKPVTRWTEVAGRLEAVNAAEIRPQVAGVITGIHFEDGAEVKRGQLLFTIDARPYEAALQSAKGALAQASSAYERARKLMAIKGISQAELEARKGAYEQASGSYKTAQVNLGYTHIVAPFAGRISRAEVTLGNLVQPGETLLASVVDVSPIYASFELDEATFLATIKNEAAPALKQVPVEVGLSDEAGTPIKATIHAFDNRIAPGTGTIRVRAKIANTDERLIPGLFAKVRIGAVEATPAVLINPIALQTDQSKKFVMIVGEGNKATYREVKVGAEEEGLLIVNEGLQGDEQVIVTNLIKLRPDLEVSPTEVDIHTLKDPHAKPADASPTTAADASHGE